MVGTCAWSVRSNCYTLWDATGDSVPDPRLGFDLRENKDGLVGRIIWARWRTAHCRPSRGGLWASIVRNIGRSMNVAWVSTWKYERLVSCEEISCSSRSMSKVVNRTAVWCQSSSTEPVLVQSSSLRYYADLKLCGIGHALRSPPPGSNGGLYEGKVVAGRVVASP